MYFNIFQFIHYESDTKTYRNIIIVFYQNKS